MYESPNHKPTLLERLSALIMREPEDRAQLIELLHSAFERNLLDADALAMIEGAMQVSEMQVRDIMIPRAQMDMIDINGTPDQFIPHVIATAHSRFPVVDKSRDEVIGINVRDMLRPAVFVPEAKRLNVLLREFRAKRNHMAVVVDEYGGVAGLVTIEDVLEQIVGEIEDEYDFDEAGDNIITEPRGRYRVKAQTEIGDFNAVFETGFSEEDQDTVGGLVIARFGHMPKRGESILIDGLKFVVQRADSRRLHTLQVERVKPL